MAASTTDLAEVRAAWRAAHLVPLWESPTAHKPAAKPDAAHLWSWETLRPLLAEAMNIASPAAVERRVLQLVSPHSQSPEDEKTVRNLSGAIQMLLPGETARPHRHSMNALRFVLEGKGAETIVNGKICPMEVGDLILTPAWCWHEHRHSGEGPMIWLDALDVPLHLSLGTSVFEPGPVKDLPTTLPDTAFAVANVLPEGAAGVATDHSPVFRYPYADAAAAVAAAPRGRDGARRVRYVNPLTGGASMALMDSHLFQLEPGEPTIPFRTNSNAICAVVEGSGASEIGDITLSWQPNDIFTLPQGNWISHRSSGGARLFVTSDRETLARLGVLQEEYGNRAA